MIQLASRIEDYNLFYYKKMCINFQEFLKKCVSYNREFLELKYYYIMKKIYLKID